MAHSAETDVDDSRQVLVWPVLIDDFMWAQFALKALRRIHPIKPHQQGVLLSLSKIKPPKALFPDISGV
jgi:hypothetical protein